VKRNVTLSFINLGLLNRSIYYTRNSHSCYCC